MDFKNWRYYCKEQIDNHFPLSVLLPAIEMTSECSKLCAPLVVPSFEHFDVISMVVKSTNHRKYLSIGKTKRAYY